MGVLTRERMKFEGSQSCPGDNAKEGKVGGGEFETPRDRVKVPARLEMLSTSGSVSEMQGLLVRADTAIEADQKPICSALSENGGDCRPATELTPYL